MSTNRIPESIKQYRPGPCTEVKFINGHYYVYMYQSLHLPSGKWGKKTGKCIGTILPESGFVPNKNYHLYAGEESQDDITVLEYGQYALIESVAKDVKSNLERHFPIDRAAQIFAYASLMYANNFIHLDQVQGYYEQSWLSHEFQPFNFTMGKVSLSTLLDDLGRRTKRVINYENDIITKSSSAIAIDGHAIRSCSDENDLGEAGYKFKSLNEDQINLLMGYDINTGVPLFARIFRGSCNDKSTIKVLDEVLDFTGILFVVDRGFYSESNLKILSANDNTYIIPVPSNTDIFKNTMKNVKYDNSFYYRNGKKHSRIEYTSQKISDMEYVYVFRDIEENEKCRFNYQRCIELGKSGYTQEKFEKVKETFGVYVLRSNAPIPAEGVYTNYKKRWGIETFYRYVKNIGNFNNLMMQDYYKEQGLSFILLITGQIHQKMLAAVKSLGDNTLSVHDIMLMARCMKMECRGNGWYLQNARKRDLQILKQIKFEPVLKIIDTSQSQN